MRINRTVKKLALIILAILLILISTFFLIQKNSKELDVNRMALVDKIENNYIFRGNNPFITKNGEKVFAYDELTTYFNDILKKKNQALLDDYYLINISLLDLDEYSEIQKEKEFFINNPNYGMAMHVSTLSPSLLLSEHPQYSNSASRAIVENYNKSITNILGKIRNLASQKTDKPTVIYIHCDGGRDRTGLITAGYRMLFKSADLSKARSQNAKDVGRNSRKLYDKAMTSYCLHIKQSYAKPENYCVSQDHLSKNQDH